VKFFAHKNFPPLAVELLRVFSGGDHEFEVFVDTYPNGATDTEWIPCLGKQAIKPLILRIGGVGRNKVERTVFREAGCSFVCFADGWSRIPWEDFAWKLLRCWPTILNLLRESEGLFVVDVSVNGKAQRNSL
jgi:hypothetical protein